MVISLTIQPQGIKEYNVTVVNNVNTSMTVIIQTFGNSGPLWGFFLVNRTEYDQLKKLDLPTRLDDLQSGYTKYADHANYYTVVHLLQDPGNYTLAFYDTLTHPASPSTFNATILNGLFGVTTSIPNPAIFDVLYLQIVAGGLILIAIVEIYLIAKKRRSA